MRRRPRNLPLIGALVAGLVLAVVWCAGPCCPAMSGGSPSPLSIGTVACCGATTPSPCGSSIQSFDPALVASHVGHHVMFAETPAPVMGSIRFAPAIRIASAQPPPLRRPSLRPTPLLI